MARMYALLLLAGAPALAFKPPAPRAALARVEMAAPLARTRPPPARGASALRGGASAVECAQHAERAASLFGNMRAPAALIAGSIVSLTFAFAMPPCAGERTKRRVETANLVIGALSLLSELIAIVHATVAVNKLTETAPRMASSVLALLQRDYELAWLGVNVHFLLGLFGIATMVGIRAWLVAGAIPAAMTASSMLLMASVANDGIRVGDGASVRFGTHFGSILVRYVRLLLAHALVKPRPLLVAALALPLASAALAARANGGAGARASARK